LAKRLGKKAQIIFGRVSIGIITLFVVNFIAADMQKNDIGFRKNNVRHNLN